MEQSPSWEANRLSVKKFPEFYGTPRFITTFTSDRHLSLSWASSTQSIPPHPTSWRSLLILSSHLYLGFPSGLFPSGFPTKTLYTPLPSSIHATCPAHRILLELKSNIDENKNNYVMLLFCIQFSIQTYKFQDIQNCNFATFLCGCETWSVTLRVGRRLRGFENIGVRSTSGTQKDENGG